MFLQIKDYFQEDWVVLCQALYQWIGEEEWSDMHDILAKRVSKHIGVKKAAQRIAGVANLAPMINAASSAPSFKPHSARCRHMKQDWKRQTSARMWFMDACGWGLEA